jgi:hypothetical protein
MILLSCLHLLNRWARPGRRSAAQLARVCASALTVSSMALLVGSSTAAADLGGSCTAHTYTVPANVDHVDIVAIGQAGQHPQATAR